MFSWRYFFSLRYYLFLVSGWSSYCKAAWHCIWIYATQTENNLEVDVLSHSRGPIRFLHFLQAEQELASNNARPPIDAMEATPDKCYSHVAVIKL